MVTMKDVARRAGVSAGTVSLVLNNKAGISRATRQRVIEAVHQLSYTPNRIARGLAMKRTHTIGLVVTDIENPFFGSVTRYITDYLRENGYTVILSVSKDDFELEGTIVERFVGNRADGVIIIPTLLKAPAEVGYMDTLRRHEVPYVFCTSYYPPIPADRIMADLEDGSYRLTRYLIELGHREILLFTTQNAEVIPSALRIAGFKRAFQEAGVPFRPDYVIPCRYPDSYHGYARTIETLRDRRPDAITAINDFLALGIIKAIWASGLSVPEDISVGGYDDVLFASTLRQPLTTVRQDVARICHETVHRLVDRIRGDTQPPRHVYVPTELVVRETTGRPQRRAGRQEQ